MKNITLTFAGALALILTLTGCDLCSKPAPTDQPAEKPVDPVTVIRVNEPLKFDGKLDEAFWQKAPAVEMTFYDITKGYPAKSRARLLRDKFNGGRCRFAYDDNYLYIAAELDDRDVYQNVMADQKYHFKFGDTFEFFIANTVNSKYWELYSTPTGHKSMLYFLAPLMPDEKENLRDLPGFEVASWVNGTLNNHDSADIGWSTELRIPLASLEKTMGVKFGPGAPFTCLVSRYNHSNDLRLVQHSSFPKQPVLNFHLVEYYAPMNILR